MRDKLSIGGKVEDQRDQWHLFRWHNISLLGTLQRELRSKSRNHLEAELPQTENQICLKQHKRLWKDLMEIR